MGTTSEPLASNATANATEGMIQVSDLEPVIARLRSILARVSAGEIVASAAFEQRLFGGLVALEAVAAGAPISFKALVERWLNSDAVPIRCRRGQGRKRPPTDP